MLRRLLFIPFGILSAIALTAVLTLIFAIEVYLDELYDGPLKQYLVASYLTFLILGIRTHYAFFGSIQHILKCVHVYFKSVNRLRKLSHK